MKNEKKLLLYAVGIVVFAIVVYAFVASTADFSRKSVAPDEASAKEVSCDITVSNPRGLPLVKNGDLTIESVNCQQQYVSNCARFGVFSDSGSLRLDAAGGLGSATEVKVSEGSSQSYSLSWCGSKLTTVFNTKLFNDNNEQIQSKEVKLI